MDWCLRALQPLVSVRLFARRFARRLRVGRRPKSRPSKEGDPNAASGSSWWILCGEEAG